MGRGQAGSLDVPLAPGVACTLSNMRRRRQFERDGSVPQKGVILIKKWWVTGKGL